MNSLNSFSGLAQNSLNKFQLNAIRGGTSGGGTADLDVDILLPDPEPDEEEN
ncbi:MAG: hypothetical protein ACLFQA_00940 [Bacteroidales bacterium]